MELEILGPTTYSVSNGWLAVLSLFAISSAVESYSSVKYAATVLVRKG